MEAEDQARVQDDVGDGADEHGEHTGLREALGRDKGIHAEGQLDEDGSHRVDVHIIHRVLNRVFAGAEGHQEIPVPDEKDGGQEDGNENLGGKAVAQGGFRRFIVLLPHGDGGPGRAAVADQGGEGRYDQDQGHADAHAGQGRGAYVLDVADVDTVHDVVEHVDQLRGYGGKSQPREQLSYGFGSQKFSVIVH